MIKTRLHCSSVYFSLEYISYSPQKRRCGRLSPAQKNCQNRLHISHSVSLVAHFLSRLLPMCTIALETHCLNTRHISNLLSSPLAVRSMQDFGLFQDQVHAPQSLAIFLQPLTPNFFRSFSISSNHLFLGFRTALFSSMAYLNTFFIVLSSGILSTRPNNCYLPFQISQIVSGSLHRSINS